MLCRIYVWQKLTRKNKGYKKITRKNKGYKKITRKNKDYKNKDVKIDMTKTKTAKQMERHLKGMANHYRIDILLFISKNTNATLDDIIKALDANEKTIGEHTRRLYVAGLVDKRYRGKFVEHTLSPYGKTFVKFLDSFRTTQ